MTTYLDIVIVNWNSGEQLRQCLASIAGAYQGGFTLSRVCVVDNASSDNSLDGLDDLPLALTIIRNTENKGFAAACNQGAAICDGEYLLFLNPDTRLCENSLSVPVEFMEDASNSRVGICGIQLVDENGEVARTCAYFPALRRFAAQSLGLNKIPKLKGTGVHMADWDHLSDRPVNHVIGAFFFMRRALFDRLGGFDERFFVYLEDIDLSCRAHQAGWQSFYLASVQAFHEGGGTSQQVKATRLFYSLRSRLIYGMKHFPLWQVWLLFALTLLVEPVSRLIFSLLRGGIEDMRNTLRGYGMLYRALPEILKNK